MQARRLYRLYSKGLHVYHMISSATKISFRNSVLVLFGALLCARARPGRSVLRLAAVGIWRRPLEGQRLFVLIYSLNYLWRHFYGVGTRRLTGWHSSFADCFSSSCTYVDVRLDIRGLVQNRRAKSFQTDAVHFKFDFGNKDKDSILI